MKTDINPILLADSYKYSMHLQYPPGTTQIHSYIESRGGSDKIVVAGWMPYLMDYLTIPVTHTHVAEAREIIEAHGLPFNFYGWDRIARRDGGRLPLKIHALPEGTVVSPQTPILTIENTDDESWWLTTMYETSLLRAIWYMSSVATVSWRIKRIILKYLERTGTPASIDFKLHDFGARGVSSHESAVLGGIGHLMNFKGTDTVEALVGARKYYDEKMAGFSIPAAEHSTITSWGYEHESAAFENMVDKFAGEGKIYAVVSDSYDIYKAVAVTWGQELKDKVIKSGGTLVIRPDSGKPIDLVVLGVMKRAATAFGTTQNEKGYLVLHPSVRVIQGDGIEEETVEKILETLAINGFSADNIAFGMGGALLQHPNRDTFRFAMKASAAIVGGKERSFSKNPASDPGKKSKAGRQTSAAMRTVYHNGVLSHLEDLATIRARLAASA